MNSKLGIALITSLGELIMDTSTLSFKTSKLAGGVEYRRAILVLLLLCPIISTLVYIARYGVNVPFLDDWLFIEFMQKYMSQGITLHDLFAQHNESRILFPRLVMLGLALATRYSSLAQMYLNWVIMCLSALIIFSIYRKTIGTSQPALLQFLPIVALLFSWRQNDNWLAGFQMVMFMAELALLCSFALLAKSETPDRYFFGAIAAALIASFSFINGLFLWPIGLFQVWRKERDRAEHGKRSGHHLSLIWGLIGLGVWTLYMIGYRGPRQHPSLTIAIEHPVQALEYFFSIIGSPLIMKRYPAIATGLLLVSFGIYSYGARFKKPTDLSFWDSLIIFTLLTAASITVGRVGFGVEQALDSRYTTFATLGIIGLHVRLLSMALRWQIRDGLIYAVFVGVIALGVGVSTLYGAYRGTATKRMREKDANALRTFRDQSDDRLTKLFPNLEKLKRLAPFLEEQKWNVFENANSR